MERRYANCASNFISVSGHFAAAKFSICSQGGVKIEAVDDVLRLVLYYPNFPREA
jgi:hypothetical protein